MCFPREKIVGRSAGSSVFKALSDSAFDGPPQVLFAGPNQIDQTSPGYLRDQTTLIGARMLSFIISFANLQTSREALLIWPLERRLRIVLDEELDRLGQLATCNLGANQSARSMPAGAPAAVTTFLSTHAFIRPGFRTHNPQDAHLVPESRRGLALQDSRCPQDQYAGTDRCGPRGCPWRGVPAAKAGSNRHQGALPWIRPTGTRDGRRRGAGQRARDPRNQVRRLSRRASHGQRRHQGLHAARQRLDETFKKVADAAYLLNARSAIIDGGIVVPAPRVARISWYCRPSRSSW
jgi:hypothetical protein